VSRLITDTGMASRQRVVRLRRAFAAALAEVHTQEPEISWLELLAALQMLEDWAVGELLKDQRGEG
jgi:hypothetical protein